MRAALLALWLAAAPAAAQDRDPLGPRDEPRFSFTGLFAYYGTMCDCDTRDLVLRTVVPLRGHADPDPASPVVRTVAAGRRVEGNDWDAEVTIVTAAPTGTLRRPLRVERARRMPDPRRGPWGDLPAVAPFTVPAGTRVTLYDSYGGDGFYHIDGVTYAADLPTFEESLWAEPVTGSHEVERWVRLVPHPGAPAAWVRLDWSDRTRVQMLCETHSGCVAGFTPTYRPDR